MELSDAQYERIAPLLPKPRGSLSIPHRQALNALLYVAKEGCSWRGLPEHFGNWHTSTCDSTAGPSGACWSGSWASSSMPTWAPHAGDPVVRQHDHQAARRWQRRPQKRGRQAIGRSRGGWTTKLHALVANERTPLKLELS